MKYLLTILIFSALSCKKDNDPVKPKADPPIVTNVLVSSETIGSSTHPKFTITLNVPDTAAVVSLYHYQNANFPGVPTAVIGNLKSGVYTIIDKTVIYPPVTPIKYSAFFAMKDGSFVSGFNSEVK